MVAIRSYSACAVAFCATRARAGARESQGRGGGAAPLGLARLDSSRGVGARPASP
jgi:hypothetical protein